MSEREAGAKRVLILGAAGRDFHDFNTCFRDDPGARVVGFTAAQIPDIAERRYPPSLGGELYPDGIPIDAEDELEAIIRERVQQCILSYSDLKHEEVMTSTGPGSFARTSSPASATTTTSRWRASRAAPVLRVKRRRR